MAVLLHEAVSPHREAVLPSDWVIMTLGHIITIGTNIIILIIHCIIIMGTGKEGWEEYQEAAPLSHLQLVLASSPPEWRSYLASTAVLVSLQRH